MAPFDVSSADKADLLSGSNATFIAELYERYSENPSSVDTSWAEFFASLGNEGQSILQELHGPSWARTRSQVIGVESEDEPAKKTSKPAAGVSEEQLRAAARDSILALNIIRAYRIRGHLQADLDPLKLVHHKADPELDYKAQGFTEADLDREIFINGVMGFQTATLRQIIRRAKETYSGKIGIEYQHIQDHEHRNWLQERMERARNTQEFSDRGRLGILQSLTKSEYYERYLDKKYKGTKRFGLDGGEAALPALEQILKRGGQLGLEEVVIGMPHRGRLNVLANFMDKPYRAIFAEFAGVQSTADDGAGADDVKYHLGTSSDREFDGKSIHLSLTANPSHLEAVNPVVVGKVRAKQEQRGDKDRKKVMALLLHGDAAFAGQGLVPETLDMSELRGYLIGGTIHFIVNNQIGFTTNPINSRSGPYCTEVAKMIEAPIFHVNGDVPEAVVLACRMAVEYRQKFNKDVVIDMFCYRRHGHNEGDEPAFTQPLMYKKIRQHPRVHELYSKYLIKEGLIDEAGVTKMIDDYNAVLDEDFEVAQSFKSNKADWLEGAWSGMEKAGDGDRRGKTSLTDETFDQVGKAICGFREDLKVNSKVQRLLGTKAEMFKSGEGFDWSTAEALAFGSLLTDDHPVRFSGQDVRRGTFSQRHAVLVDQETEETYVSVNHVREDQAKMEIVNSPLSEAAVLGFEYGYSMAEPNALTLWEAQFGDFVNGAQIIIDQFIATSEAKWLRMSGLVMLLPHGYEGQGPEHSSARIERFLQSSGEDNWQIVNCTTPGNYFHVLRRQIHRDFRKPLIIFTPKSLLRHKKCVSSRHHFTNGSSFHRVLYDDVLTGEKKDMKRIVFCSGKVYYDLLEERDRRGLKDIYFLRMEQLYPFPKKALLEELKELEHCELVWCQEEPKNMGAWSFIEPHFEEVLTEVGMNQTRLAYAGRKVSASPATGSNKRHVKEQADLVEAALVGPLSK